MTRLRVASVLSVLAWACAADAAERPSTEDSKLAPILERAGRYVVEYGKVFSDLVAQEDYRQDFPQLGRPQPRYSRADLVFVTMPGAIPWATFRDVYEVDGNKVRDRSARLERLFVESPGHDVVARAHAILAESSRFNLGPVQRTVNIPTLALLFLHPDTQGRFAFERKGGGQVAGVEAVQIAFIERARPTVVGSASGAEAASVAMTTLAKYGGYRRFEVTTDETYQPPDKK
jgi:hypothetical protein